jgi:hypothetical protein
MRRRRNPPASNSICPQFTQVVDDPRPYATVQEPAGTVAVTLADPDHAAEVLTESSDPDDDLGYFVLDGRNARVARAK